MDFPDDLSREETIERALAFRGDPLTLQANLSSGGFGSTWTEFNRGQHFRFNAGAHGTFDWWPSTGRIVATQTSSDLHSYLAEQFGANTLDRFFPSLSL